MRSIHRNIAVAATAMLGLACLAPSASAQNFPDPNKPITLILPFPPGGSVDTGFRIIAPAVAKILKAQIDVVNKGGGGGQSGITDFIRQGKPDGYTLVNVGLPTVLTQYLDPARGAIYSRKNFQPVAQMWSSAYGIAVKADSPIQDLPQFLQAVKDKNGKFTVGDPGLMTAPHIMAAIFQDKAKVKFASVHFNGGAASFVALLGGHIEAATGGLGDFTPNLANKAIRVLAFATAEPTPIAGVKTMASYGVPMEFLTVQSVAAIAGTPMPIVRTLEAAFRTALSDPDTKAKMIAYGNPAAFLGSDELGKVWDRIESDLKPVLGDMLKEESK